MKFTLAILVSIVLLVLSACGKDDSGDSQASALIGDYYCKTPTHSLQGCCSYHNGAKTCAGQGDYQFNSSGRLICNDGALSPTCTY